MTERTMTEIGLAASRWYSARLRRLAGGRAKKAAEELRDAHERLHGWAAGNPYWRQAHIAGEVHEAAKLRERKALRALGKLCAQHVTAEPEDVVDLTALPRLPNVGPFDEDPQQLPKIPAAHTAEGAA